MSGMLRKLAVVAFAGHAVGCSDGSSITDLTDIAPSFHKGKDKDDDGRGRKHDRPRHGLEGYTVLEGQLPADQRSASAEIGPEGGVLVLWGPEVDGRRTFHALQVPRGAVRSTHIFTITLSSDTRIEVELEAFRVGRHGRLRSVGHKGFRKPIGLTLSYAFSTNEVPDPSKLSIVYLVDEHVEEVLPTRARAARKFVTGELRHFSRYAVAMN